MEGSNIIVRQKIWNPKFFLGELKTLDSFEVIGVPLEALVDPGETLPDQSGDGLALDVKAHQLVQSGVVRHVDLEAVVQNWPRVSVVIQQQLFL